MTSVQSLPPDQRAVLELVLRRGRTYDEIAQLLSVDRAGVRQRALSALDALGPDAGVPAERRALITDYLLGALPPRVAAQVRDRLGTTPAERAWARVIAAELEPLASNPLPEIPFGGEPVPDEEDDELAAFAEPWPEGAPEKPELGEQSDGAALAEEAPQERGRRRRDRARAAPAASPPAEAQAERPASRRGGRVVLTAAAIIVLAVILSVVLSSGNSNNKSSSHVPTTGTTLTNGSGTTTAATTPTTPASSKVLAQVNLNPPSGGRAKGIAEVLRESGRVGLAIVATGLKANSSHDAYAVWLYNSPSDSHLLGFVSPGVNSTGRLQTAGALPSNASHFHKLLVTLETKATPTSPGPVVLQGTLSGL